MKTILIKTYLAVALFLFATTIIYSQPVPSVDSCLKLVIPDEPNLGDINPDSVRVDSCIGSPTFGKLFAKKYYYLQFKPNVFPFDSQIHPDSLKRVSDISSSKAEMKAEFEQLENQFGTIYFQGREYQMDSSDFAKDPGCRLLFEDYQNIEDIIDSFTENISELDTIVYFDIVKILLSFPTPKDLALEPNLYLSDILLNFGKNRDWYSHTWSDFYTTNYQAYGYETALYELNCPMAWEITQGSSNIIIGINDIFKSPSEHPDVIQNFHNPSKGDGLAKSRNLSTGHGLQVMSDAVARGGNGYPMVGTAPYCKGVAIISSSLDYDMDGIKNDYSQYVDIENCSYIGGKLTNDVLDSGIVVVAAVGNDRNQLGSSGGRHAVAMPNSELELRPTRIYPGASTFYDDLDPTNHTKDYKVIAVGATMSGVLKNINCEAWPTKSHPNYNAEINPNYSKEIQFSESWNFSPGIDKFSTNTNATNRISDKEDAFVDVVAPGRGILSADEVNPLEFDCDNLHTIGSMDWFCCKLDIPLGILTSIEDLDAIMTSHETTNNYPGTTKSYNKLRTLINNAITDGRKYTIAHGTSMSTPLVSGVVGLMLSMNKFMGVPLKLDLKPENGKDVQRSVYNALTFTTKKIKDFQNFSTDRFESNGTCYYSNSFPNGAGYQYDYRTQFNDLLQRSWAQRVGFGLVNAYRAVAHSIRQKGDYEYNLTANKLLLANYNDGAPNYDSRGYVNPDGIRVMHWGSKVKEGSSQFEIPIKRGPSNSDDGILNVLEWGGVSLPGEFHNNQGVTKITSVSDDTRYKIAVLTDCILAIDGILFSDKANACHYITTTGLGASESKILMEGYIKDVEIFGNLRIGDLIIESSIDDGISGIPGCVGFGAGAESEIYGTVETRNHGYLYTWGNVHTKPGATIKLNGFNNLELFGSSDWHFEHSTRVESNSNKKIVVNNGTRLVIDSSSVVELDVEVNVKSGGEFYISVNSIVKLKKLNVEPGGTIIINPNATLSLDDQEHICNGNFLAYGDANHRVKITGNLNDHCLPYDDVNYSDFAHISTQPIIYMRGDCLLPDLTGLSLKNVTCKDISFDIYNARVIGDIENCEFLTNTKLTNPYFNFNFLLSLRRNNCDVCPSPLVSNVSIVNSRFQDLSQPISSANDPNNLNELEFRTGGLIIDGYNSATITHTQFKNLEYGLNTFDCLETLLSESRFDSCGIGNYDFGSKNYMCRDTFSVVQYATIRDHSLESKTASCYYNITRVAYRAESSQIQKLRDNQFIEYLQGVSSSHTKIKMNEEIGIDGYIIYGGNTFIITPLTIDFNNYVNKYITKICEFQLSTDLNLENQGAIYELYCGKNGFSNYATYNIRKDNTFDAGNPYIDITYNYFENPPRTVNVAPNWLGQPGLSSLNSYQTYYEFNCCGDLAYSAEYSICEWATTYPIISCEPYVAQYIAIYGNEFPEKARHDTNLLNLFEQTSNKSHTFNLLSLFNAYKSNNLTDSVYNDSHYASLFRFLSNGAKVKITADKLLSNASLLSYVQSTANDKCQNISYIDDANITNSISKVDIIPNPVNNTAILSFNIQQLQEISIQILNIEGNVVMELDKKYNYSNGNNIVDIDFSRVPSGVYFVKISNNNTFITKQFIIQK